MEQRFHKATAVGSNPTPDTKMTKTIIFDADGMIVRGERFSSRLEKEFGISTVTTGKFFRTEFQDCLIGRTDLKEILPRYFSEWGWSGTVDQLLKFWFDERANIIDERFELIIKNLKGGGVYCCLATNNEKYRSLNLAKDRGLEKWFDGIFSSCAIGHKKPDPEFFQSILDKIDATKEAVQFWDNGQENIDGARAFGLESRVYNGFEQFLDEVKKF